MPRSGRSPWRLRLLALVLLGWLAGSAGTTPLEPATSRPGPTPEYHVIANYLAAFLRHVVWPAAPAPTREPVRIGVLGKDPFGATLDHLLAGKSIGGRPLAAVRATAPEKLSNCQVVFLNPASPAELAAALQLLAGQPVLTVVYHGGAPSHPPSGAAIELIRVNGNIRFRIDLDRLAAQGLRPTPSLLDNALRPAAPPPTNVAAVPSLTAP